MNKCYNHPERIAYSICSNCGRYYCEECLLEGTDYYYCKSSECRSKWEKDIGWKKIMCPNCFSILEINEYEYISKKLRCPECDSFIIMADSRPILITDTKYIKYLTSLNQADIAIIKSILDSVFIDYYITGETTPFGPIDLYINEIDIDEARWLLIDFEFYLSHRTGDNKDE